MSGMSLCPQAFAGVGRTVVAGIGGGVSTGAGISGTTTAV
jgi:hypothetical protein